MTDTTITESGLFSVVEDRTVRGLLLPYGEASRLSKSKTAPVTFAPGVVTIPRDPGAVTLNVEHDHFSPLGRATSLTETPEGVVAEFAIFDTDEGDAYLAAPEKQRLSVELTGLIRAGADAVAARITGAAVVTEGAYASAALFAIGDVEDAPTDTPAADDAVLRVEAAEIPEAVEVSTADTTVTFTPDADDTDATEVAEEATMATAIAPVTAADSADLDAAKQAGANAVFAAMTAVQHGDRDAEQMLAALADVKHSGSGALPAAGVLQPDWVGEVWSGRAYSRKYINLGTTGTIRAMDAKGFRLDQGTALVQHWAGNKSELPTGTASTSIVTSTLLKYGYAADIAREFFDLPGGEEVIAAFWSGVVESYARLTDADALAAIVAAAGTPVAAETFPTDYPSTLGMLIQGITHIEDANDTPTFAIMNGAAYREAIYAGKDALPEFVKFGFNTQATGTADGITVVRGDLGIEDTPAVLVGSKAGIRFNELGTTPVQFDALDVARGGVDRAVVGYLQTMTERPESFVLIGQADAPVS